MGRLSALRLVLAWTRVFCCSAHATYVFRRSIGKMFDSRYIGWGFQSWCVTLLGWSNAVAGIAFGRR